MEETRLRLDTPADVRQRYPAASPREHVLRLAIVTLGPEPARKAYPEIAARDLGQRRSIRSPSR